MQILEFNNKSVYLNKGCENHVNSSLCVWNILTTHLIHKKNDSN